jgi:hypothetical protein
MDKRRWIAFAAIAVFAVAWAAIRKAPRGRHAPAAGTSPAGRPPLERVQSFAATIAEYHERRAQRPLPAFDVEKERLYRSLIEQPLDVRAELGRTKESWRWSPTVLAIEDPAFLAKKRLACDATLGKELVERCSYRLDMVVERGEREQGRIVFSRAAVVDERPEPICPFYAECIAEARLGEVIPLPPDARPHEAILQRLSLAHPSPAMLDPARSTRTFERLKIALAQLRVQVDLDDPASVHALRRHEAIVGYGDARARAHRARPDGGRP